MNKTIGVVAHVDAGKTTLIEQLLYNTDTIESAGRVDKQNTFLDYHSIEKKRGITVFSEQAKIQYKNSTIHIVDTPGHIDFCSEMERSISILDCCILVISASSGIQAHTETLWKLLRKNNIPTIIFINKLDIIGSDFNKVLESINTFFSNNTLLLTKPNYVNDNFENIISLFSDTFFEEEVIGKIAEYDDTILEKYLNEESIEYNELLNSIVNLVMSCKVFPVMSGACLKNIGVLSLLDIIDKIIVTNYNENEKFKGLVYKIRYDESMQKLTYIKVLSGSINVKHTLIHEQLDEPSEEKINQIRVYNGNNYTQAQSLKAGEYGALLGINDSFISECFGDISLSETTLMPALKSKVIFDSKYNYKDILKIFEILTEEDPTLNVSWISEINEIHINIMGYIQLEILAHTVLERFNVEVSFDKPEVVYLETIKEETTGLGHFEPYKHFAEAVLKISPAKRGQGINFKSSLSVDDLQLRWQRMIEKLIIPACKRGILTGSMLADLDIELIDGKSHVKHTSGGDFKEATFRAVRKAIEQVENELLEPYYSFRITVSNELSGRVMTDITKMYGTFEAPTSIGDNSTIVGRVPVSTFIEYPSTLASFTKGKGLISFNLDGYDTCHNTEEVIEKIGYDPKSDKDHTSHSIYVSHGKTFSVE